jgi:putative PEP-CTERM system TPR-repeat lipoprotein
MTLRFPPPFLQPLLLALVLVGCGGPSEADYVASAREMVQKRDFKAAGIQLKSAIQLNPQAAEARFLFGKVLLETGDSAAAAVELRKAAELGYDENQLAPLLASAMVQQGEAKQVVEQFASKNPTGAEERASLKTSLALAYSRLGDSAKAGKSIDEALAAKANHIPALLARAGLAAQNKDFAVAIATLDEVNKLDATRVDAWMLKGEIQQRGLGEPTAALASFRKAIEIRKDSMGAHEAIVTLLIASKDLPAARAHVAEMKKSLADRPETRLLEAQLAYVDKDFKKSRELAVPLVQLAPNNPLVLQLAGASEYQLGALPQAENLLAQAVKMAPGLPMATALLARLYVRSGQSDKALEILQPALAAAEPAAELLLIAGEAYLQSGNSEQADQAFARAAKVAPSSARARTALALNQIGKGQSAEGMSALESISSKDSGTSADLALIASHLRRGDLAKASLAADVLVRKRPDSAAAHNLKGRVLALRGDSAGARNSFERAMALDSKYFPALVSLAALDMAEKKPEASRKRFEAAIAADPRNHQAKLGLAALLRQTGAPPSEVLPLLDAAVKASPGDLQSRLQLIEFHWASGNLKAALAACQEADTAIPNRRELLLLMGRVQLAGKDFQQALTTFNRVIALQPASAPAALGIAEAMLGQKDHAAAERQLQRLLQSNPQMLPARRMLAGVYLARDRKADAIALARDLQKLSPTLSTGYTLEAEIEAQQRNWSGAQAAYRTALQKQPAAETATKLHATLLMAGRADEAQKFASGWLAEHAKDAGFRFYLGDAALSRKDWGEAERSYREVLRVQPENPLAMNNVAWLLIKQGKAAGALPLAEKAVALAPGRTQLLDTLALAMAANNQLPQALELQRKTLKLAPQDPQLRLTLARLFIQSGAKPEARAELEDLAKLGTSFVDHAEVTDLLKQV